MPRTVKPKERTKRTKTYTGCWTCRSRGVKCDSTRPTCLRCNQSKRTCEGYGIRLVWVDQQSSADSTTRSGRLQLSAQDRACPVFSEEYIDSALTSLSLPEDDSEHAITDLIIGPYTVFRAKASEPTPAHTEVVTPPVYHDTGIANIDPLLDFTAISDLDDDIEHVQEIQRQEKESISLSPQLLSSLQNFISTSSENQRFLLRTWVTSMSGLLTPIDHPDNPYRKIFIPLALESAGSDKPGNLALIHAMYSMTAFNLAHLNASEKFAADGQSYHQTSLSYLRRSLQVSDESQNHAILACLILMICVDAINGKLADWRIHIRGGRRWLSSLDRVWERNETMSTLYQMFECIEILGLSHSPDEAPCDSEPAWLPPPTPPQALSFDQDIPFIFGEDEGSASFKHFGITKPVLQAIKMINHYERCDRVLIQEEILALKTDILLANPTILRFSSRENDAEEMIREHASAFYYACVIYFERAICRTPARDIQHLVSQTLYHLEAVAAMETWGVCGILWPNFISACEAEDADLRRRSLHLLEKRRLQGIGSIAPMEDGIKRLWEKRDLAGPEVDVDRRKVMRELGIDILPL